MNHSANAALTSPKRPRAMDRQGALAVLVVLLVLLSTTTVRAGTKPKPVLRVESSATGEIQFEARGATIEDALHAIASQAGFEVLIQDGIPRPPVNIAVPAAPVEDVLRELLRGRNYALVYDADDGTLSQVIILVPSALGSPGVPLRRPPGRR